MGSKGGGGSGSSGASPDNPYTGQGRGGGNDRSAAIRWEQQHGKLQPKPEEEEAPVTAFPPGFFEGFGGGGGHRAGGYAGPSGPTYEQQLAEQERIEGENQRDQVYSDYLSAADQATNFVNEQITREQSNAALTGVDYEITDEIKTNRINNYFATIWGEGDQTSLTQLMSQYGRPAGFSKFLVTRGDAESGAAETGGDETETTSTTVRRPTLLGEDEETLGDAATILGGA